MRRYLAIVFILQAFFTIAIYGLKCYKCDSSVPEQSCVGKPTIDCSQDPAGSAYLADTKKECYIMRTTSKSGEYVAKGCVHTTLPTATWGNFTKVMKDLKVFPNVSDIKFTILNVCDYDLCNSKATSIDPNYLGFIVLMAVSIMWTNWNC